MHNQYFYIINAAGRPLQRVLQFHDYGVMLCVCYVCVDDFGHPPYDSSPPPGGFHAPIHISTPPHHPMLTTFT